MEFLETIVSLVRRIAHFLWFSNDGHVSHFVAGLIIGAFVSMFIFRKSGSKMKAALLGLAVAALIGFLKEFIDPFVDRQRDSADFYYTCLGGLLGSMTVFSKRMLKVIFPEG
jgi:VanZ family protein